MKVREIVIQYVIVWIFGKMLVALSISNIYDKKNGLHLVKFTCMFRECEKDGQN